MGIVQGAEYVVMDDDPDDYRPNSAWSLHADPDGRTSLSVVRERIGVGDRIPRHWHDIDEVLLYESGLARVFLDGEERNLGAGSSVFIPAGAVHGCVNIGNEPVPVRAVYPATVVRMDLVERNPMPGRESDPPMASVYDMATGEFTVLGATKLPSGY